MLFNLQLLISFILGGLFIALQSLIAERVKGFWRNIVLTVPSTMALGLFFIGLTKTPQDVVQASLMVPAGLSADYIFVMFFALLARFNFYISLIGSLSAWAISGLVLILYPPASYMTSIFIYALPIIVITYFVVKKLPQTQDLKPFPMTSRNIFIRAMIGGSVIFLIVLLSKTLGNIWGGLFTVFPASYTATFSIYYHMQGKESIPTVAKTLFFPGIIGFIIYGWIVAETFPLYGIWLGTLFAYLGTFIWYSLYNLTQKRLLSKV